MPRTFKVCRPEDLVHAGDVDMPVLFGYMSRTQWNQLIAQQHPLRPSDPFAIAQRSSKRRSCSASEPPPLLSANTSSSINSFTSSNEESIFSDNLGTSSLRTESGELSSDPSGSLTEYKSIVAPQSPVGEFLAVSSASDFVCTNNDPALSIANEVQQLRKQIDSTKKIPAWPSRPSSPAPVSHFVPSAGGVLSFELDQFSDLDEANYTSQIELEVMLALHRLAGYGHMVTVEQYMKQPDPIKWVYLADRVDQKQAY